MLFYLCSNKGPSDLIKGQLSAKDTLRCIKINSGRLVFRFTRVHMYASQKQLYYIQLLHETAEDMASAISLSDECNSTPLPIEYT